MGLRGPSGGLPPWDGGSLGVILGGLDLGAGSGLDSAVSSAAWTSDLAAMEEEKGCKNICPLLDS